jgi:hypothetical protein
MKTVLRVIFESGGKFIKETLSSPTECLHFIISELLVITIALKLK